MNPHRSRLSAHRLGAVCLLFLLGPLALGVAWAASGAKVVPPTSLVVHGDSTLHEWQAKATKLSVTGRLPELPAAATRVDSARCRSDLVLTVPVRGLKSGKSGLDSNMYKALDADRHPHIRYAFSHCSGRRTGKGPWTLRAAGTLTIKGVKRPLTMTLRAEPTGRGLRLTGRQALKMTDFGVEPPSFMFGRLKTANRVDVHIDVTLSRP